jgi:hypothetical protein
MPMPPPLHPAVDRITSRADYYQPAWTPEIAADTLAPQEEGSFVVHTEEPGTSDLMLSVSTGNGSAIQCSLNAPDGLRVCFEDRRFHKISDLVAFYADNNVSAPRLLTLSEGDKRRLPHVGAPWFWCAATPQRAAEALLKDVQQPGAFLVTPALEGVAPAGASSTAPLESSYVLCVRSGQSDEEERQRAVIYVGIVTANGYCLAHTNVFFNT